VFKDFGMSLVDDISIIQYYYYLTHNYLRYVPNISY
jgi:hypothetical protein